MIKFPKTIVCDFCQVVVDFEYGDYILSQNGELYDFTTSYFVNNLLLMKRLLTKLPHD